MKEISHGRVTVGPGTLYAMLAKFEENDVVFHTREEGRRKWYVLTPKGIEMLRQEQERLHRQAEDGAAILGNH